MTLPSLGRLPGAHSLTSPRSLVTSRMVSVRCATSPSGAPATSTLRHMRSLAISPLTTSRALRTSGWRRAISATWPACTNMPRTLAVWSARPIQPLMRVLVRPVGQVPGSTAERSPVPNRISG